MSTAGAAEVWIEPDTVLEGPRLRLEPAHQRHAGPLWDIAKDTGVWTWIPAPILSKAQLLERIAAAQTLRERGITFAFVILDKASGEYAGSTSFLNIERQHRRLEIGFTWLGLSWQRTHVNTEAKFLLLRHAFESLACIRVEFKTDAKNAVSRAALKRIGAREEGCLRQHMVCHDGRLRDSIYFSILDSEWREVKEDLIEKMNRHSRGGAE